MELGEKKKELWNTLKKLDMFDRFSTELSFEKYLIFSSKKEDTAKRYIFYKNVIRQLSK